MHGLIRTPMHHLLIHRCILLPSEPHFSLSPNSSEMGGQILTPRWGGKQRSNRNTDIGKSKLQLSAREICKSNEFFFITVDFMTEVSNR